MVRRVGHQPYFTGKKIDVLGESSNLSRATNF